MRLLLNAGVEHKPEDSLGLDLLQLAKFGGREQVVRVLLDRGEGIESKNPFGLTPLQSAVTVVNENMVRMLLDRGADINATGLGFTAAQIAACMRNEEMLQLLLARGGVYIQDEAFQEEFRKSGIIGGNCLEHMFEPYDTV